MDAVQNDLFRQLLHSGDRASPRNLSTKECLAVGFELKNPRRRCITNTARRWSLPLALGEICWHLSASNKAAELEYYAPIWKSFADSRGRIMGSCYGSRVFSNRQGGSLWSSIQRLLRLDPRTRRAVLVFTDDQGHLDPKCADAACATSLQFLIRGNRLHAIATMRSNDAVWGLPYDVFFFSFLQELMSVELGVELGFYSHFVGSLHIYERHLDLAERVLASKANPDSAEMPQIGSTDGIKQFLSAERALRENKDSDLLESLPPYWRDLGRVLHSYSLSKVVGWADAIKSAQVPEPYLTLLMPLVNKATERAA